jgi:hypothetical protein
MSDDDGDDFMQDSDEEQYVSFPKRSRGPPINTIFAGMTLNTRTMAPKMRQTWTSRTNTTTPNR